MYLKFFEILMIVNLSTFTLALLKFTNLQCEELDVKFATFKECNLKLLKRDTVALNVHVKLYELPVTNVSINLSLLKKANGYKPFLYNATIDFCKFLKNQNSNLFVKVFYHLFRTSSNVNHTCPFNHDIIIHNLVLQTSMLNMMPLPAGEYMFRLKVAAYNDFKADVKVYFLFNAKKI